MACQVVQMDALKFLASLDLNSVDLVFGSGPYEDCRTYGIDFNLKGQDWVDWMVQVFQLAQNACRGLVAFVVEGKTRKFQWSATPALLMADLHRAGFKVRKPPIYKRYGIPGSGGPDWLRNNYEFIVCTSKGRLPWSDNKAMGHKPKFAPGGKLTYRTQDGTRRHLIRGISGYVDGDSKYHGGGDANLKDRAVTEIANPGNVIDCGAVGGGHLGSKLAHENEAPFPEALVEPFVRSFCPPDGLVVDPFCGSGTVGAVAKKFGRNFIGCDIRQSQVDLTLRRLASIPEYEWTASA